MLAACGGSSDGDSTSTIAQSRDASIQRYWILPETIECVGEAVQQCLQVAESEDGEHQFFYDNIEGFTFEEGTSYVIDVEVSDVENPPADGSSLSYRLVEVIESAN